MSGVFGHLRVLYAFKVDCEPCMQMISRFGQLQGANRKTVHSKLHLLVTYVHAAACTTSIAGATCVSRYPVCTCYNNECQGWATSVNLDCMAVTAVSATLHFDTDTARGCTGVTD